MYEKPRHWNTWKGKVLRTIILDNTSTLNDIQNKSGLTQMQLKEVMDDMQHSNIIRMTIVNGKYEWQVTDDDLFRAYLSAMENQVDVVEKSGKIATEQIRYHTEWIKSWFDQDDVDGSLDNLHFFLEGKPLEFITKRLMERSQNSIYIVHPFVDITGIGTTLRVAAMRGVEVLLISGNPHNNVERQKLYNTLMDAKVKLYYSGTDSGAVNSKILAVDDEIAIVSSMNFTKGAEAAITWETGIVTADKKVVDSAIKAI